MYVEIVERKKFNRGKWMSLAKVLRNIPLILRVKRLYQNLDEHAKNLVWMNDLKMVIFGTLLIHPQTRRGEMHPRPLKG